MSVRDARVEDCGLLAQSIAQQNLLTRYQRSAEQLENDLKGAIGRGEPLIVVEDSGGPCGFAWFLTSGTFGAGGYLRLIALVPGSERRGLGAALLDEVERRVKQHSKHLFLLVSHWNQEARRFYARQGFVECGALPGFVLNDTDEIVCWKRL
jgi:ribosomal protein S18 acetylase RimI-like enzyme